MQVVDTPSGERWLYRYDPFGRRVGKRCDQKAEETRYQWDGDQIAEIRHYRHGQLVARRHWVYNGWELVVQQRQHTGGDWETDFVTSSQNGTPQALFTPDGTLRWQAPTATLWGQRQAEKSESPDPGLAFAGQLRDSESGLCYNRFRYYDPAGGCYVSPDPIGIAGGESNYGYVPNPVGWVDPFGLAGCSTTLNYWKNEPIQFKGNKVYQRDDLFDPNRMTTWRDKGKVFKGTNVERMATGRAPVGYDGKAVNLHHMLQSQKGPIAEMSQSFHKSNHGIIHINPNTIPSGIDRVEFNAWREEYWMNRASGYL